MNRGLLSVQAAIEIQDFLRRRRPLIHGSVIVWATTLAVALQSHFVPTLKGQDESEKQTPKVEFAPGDRVDIKLALTTRPGEIVRKVVTNIYEVRMLDTDPPEVRNWPVGFLRPASKDKPPETKPSNKRGPKRRDAKTSPDSARPPDPTNRSTPNGVNAETADGPRPKSSDQGKAGASASVSPSTESVAGRESTGKQGLTPARSETSDAARMWTDRSGKFRIEAKLVEYSNGLVSLRRMDGRYVTLEIEKLSSEDQEYVRRLSLPETVATAPLPSLPARVDEIPSRSNIVENRPTSGDAKGAEAGPLPLTKPDWSDTHHIVAGGEPPTWSVRPDGVEIPDTKPPRPIGLRRDERSMATVSAFVFAHAQSEVVVARGLSDRRRETETLLEWYHLDTGRSGRVIKAPPAILPLAISPNGELLLSKTVSQSNGPSERLDVWKPVNKRLESVVHFMPYLSSSDTGCRVLWAEWVDDSHFVTLTHDDRLTLWEIPGARAIYSLQLAKACRPAISPGRKQLAVITSAGYEIYRVVDGELLGRLGSGTPMWPALGFSSDGRQLAVGSAYRMEVWNLETGKKVRDIPMPITGENSRVHWITDDYLVSDSGYTRLVDLSRRIVLWDYMRERPREPELFGVRNGYCWHLANDRVRDVEVLVPIRLPHAAARQVAAKLNPDAILAVKPGLGVSLVLNLAVPPEKIEEIRQELHQKLETNGLRVSPGQRLVLTARTGTGKTYPVQYRSSFGRGQTTVNATEQKSELEFTLDGQSVWKAENVAGPPFFVSLKEGESVEQAVLANTKPKLGFFLDVELPSHIVRPTGKVAYGRDIFNADGTTRPFPGS